MRGGGGHGGVAIALAHQIVNHNLIVYIIPLGEVRLAFASIAANSQQLL